MSDTDRVNTTEEALATWDLGLVPAALTDAARQRGVTLSRQNAEAIARTALWTAMTQPKHTATRGVHA